MQGHNDTTAHTPNVREAFPALPEGMEAEAAARIARYVALVHRIYERIREDPGKYAAFQRRLTELTVNDSMGSLGKRRSPFAPSS